MTISFCQQSVDRTNKNSRTIGNRTFPDCLATAPNERDITSLLVALDIDNRDEYLIAVDMTKTFTLSGKGLKRSKEGDDYVLSGASLTYSELLELSKTQDITWFPNPVDPGAYGRSSSHVARFTTIVVENDEKSLNEQWKQVQWLGALGLPPTSVVYTGGKSLHLYFRLSHDVSSDDYLNAKKALVMLLGADTSVSLVEKSRLPGFHRPNKQYPQQLVYNTATRTDINDIFDVFRGQYSRDITEDLWTEYKLSRAGKSTIAPDKVLYTPDEKLPLVVNREVKKKQLELRKQHRIDNPISVDNENYYQACTDAITKIDEDACIEDFINLGFKVKKSYRDYTIGSFNEGGKGTSVKIQAVDGKLLAYSFKGCLTGASSSASYSQLWFDLNGFNNLSGADFFKAVESLASASGVMLPERPKYRPNRPNIPNDIPDIPGNKTISISERYLPTGLIEDINAPVVAIKSDWGTGKTTLMRAVIDRLDINDWFIMLTPLQSLARNNAVNLNIYYKTEYDKHTRHVSMCLHNLHDKSSVGAKLLPQLLSTTGKIHLVFDEAECLRKGLLALDSTLSKNQIGIIRTIGDIAALPSTTTWLLDADLTRDTVNFYTDCVRQSLDVDISHVIPVHWIENSYRNQIDNLYLYPTRNIDAKKSCPATVLKHALESASESDDMILLAVTGQKISHKTGKYSTESAALYFTDRGYEGRVLVVDSESSAVEGSLAAGIVDDPSTNLRLAKERGYKVIVFTLGIFKTGISIEDGEDRLFSHVYVVSTGLISPELTIQALFRYRNLSVPRYLFVPEQGFNYLAGRAKTHAKAVSTLKKDKIEELYSHSLRADTAARTVKVNWLLEQWSSVVVTHNTEMTQYYEAIKTLLPRAVKTLHTNDLNDFGEDRLIESGKEVKAILSQYQEDNALINAIAITESPDLTPKDADNLKQKNKKTKEENRALVKYFLTHTTGRNELTPEDVYNNDEGYFNKAKLYLLATKAYPLVAMLDAIALSKIEDGNPIRRAGAVRKFKVDTAKKVLELGLEAVIESGKVSNSCPLVNELRQRMIDDGLLTEKITHTKRGETTYLISTGELEEWIGLITFKSVTDLIKKLLGELGITLVLTSDTKKDENGNKIREYDVRSSWCDVAGNHTREPIDRELENHWLTGYLVRCLTHLTGEEIAREDLGERLHNLPDDDKFNPLRDFCIRL